MVSITFLDEPPHLPPSLRPGMRVGVFAPSALGSTRFPERFERGVAALSRSLGAEVVVPAGMENPLGRLAGSGRERADVFSSLVRNRSIGAIFTTYGGFNTSDMLPHVDWEALRANPKIVVGYSDTTALLMAVQAKAGLVTYYGPAVLPQFGEIPAPLAYTVDALKRVLIEGRGGMMAEPAEWCARGPDWATHDGPRPRHPRAPLVCIRAGDGRGRLFGGNVSTLNFQIGTPYFRPPPAPFLLFIEMVNAEAEWFSLRRSLTQFREIGLMAHVAGLIVGRSPQTGPINDLAELLLDVFGDYDFPIAGNAPFGHTDPIATLPVGVETTLSCAPGRCIVEFHGPAVEMPK